jgi:hypothetical protein
MRWEGERERRRRRRKTDGKRKAKRWKREFERTEETLVEALSPEQG